MSEYLHVEKPFLQQLATLGWGGGSFIDCLLEALHRG